MKQRYTLVELLVVIIIIGILAGLLIPAIGSARQTAREHACASGCMTLMQALKSFESDYQKFPVNLSYGNGRYTPIGGGVEAPTAKQTSIPAAGSGSTLQYDYTMAILTGYVGGQSSLTELTSSSDFGRNKKKTRYIEPPTDYLTTTPAYQEIGTKKLYSTGFYANSFGERYYLVFDTNGEKKMVFKRPSPDGSTTAASNLGANNLDTTANTDYTTTVIASVGVFCSLAPYDTTSGAPWASADRIATSWAGIIANEK